MCKPNPANSLPSREAASSSSRSSQQPSCPYSGVHLWSQTGRGMQDRVTGLTFHSLMTPYWTCDSIPATTSRRGLCPFWDTLHWPPPKRLRIHLKSHFSHLQSCPSLGIWQNFELPMLQNDARTYLRKFSRSSRLQDDQERSLGFRPFTHSPDMMCDRPAQDEWSSSWFIPRLLRKKEKEWSEVSHVPHF